MPSLIQLEYIAAVADHQHFGKAARACHVTQPTLSQQVMKVEENLGITLFDRIKKPVVLTPEGEIFLDQARLILREHKRLKEMVRSNSKEVSGTFHLAIIPTVAGTLIPRFIEPFAKKFPKVELYIDELTTESILEGLKQDRLDAAIMATPLPNESLQEMPLYYEPFKLYLAKNHPLLKKATCSKKDLDGNGLCFCATVIASRIRWSAIAPCPARARPYSRTSISKAATWTRFGIWCTRGMAIP